MKNNATFGAHMKRKRKRITLLALLFVATCFRVLAQPQQPGEDFMRSMGKMYVVVAVIAVIFLGILVFLVYLDRKLTRLENQTKA